MWGQVAVQFNSQSPRGAPQRDFEALRRKFRTMHSTNKPTGRNRLSQEQEKLLLRARDIHRAIELKVGARTSHDGSDHGEDDEELVKHVDALAAKSASASDELDTSDAEDHEDPRGNVEDEESEDEGVCISGRPGVDGSQSAEDVEEAPGRQEVNSTTPGNAQEFTSAVGSLITQDGILPAEFADDLDEWRVPEAEQASAQGSATDNREDDTTLGPTTDGGQVSVPRPDNDASSDTPRPQQARNSSRSAGRPRRASREPLPSSAAPNGPNLRVDPANTTADAQEQNAHKRLAPSSNRLGGRDLRVLRDNFEQMGGRTTSSREKRPAAESASATNYAAAKRFKAKQRMDSLDRELAALEAQQRSGGAEMMQMLLFFREEAERKAAAEDRVRREEREERREAERVAKEDREAEAKREREERERERREVAAKQERILEEARLQREEKEQKDKADRAEREEERAENRRRFEQRLELDRAEARQRYEQMTMLLSALIQKPQ